jgi:predicted alpha/beta superfamily hydrolase
MIKKLYLVLLSVFLFTLFSVNCLTQTTTPPPVHTLVGTIKTHPKFFSKNLSNNRDIIVYLPPNYEKEVTQHYPVFYLHDGQNIFDGATSFIAGSEWQCDETAQKLILANKIQPIIIVGIYNTGEERINEYTYSVDTRYNKGGKANLYGKFLVEELKPFIDNQYRTLSDSDHTALGGSSLGGLVSLFIGLQYPNVFGKLAVMSPSVWWDNRIILKDIKNLPQKPNITIWLDIGTEEDQESVPDTEDLKNLLLDKGWKLDKDLKYLVAKDAKHNESAWSSRFDKVLEFLFPVNIKH